MAAFVGDDPDTGEEQAGPEGVQRPNGEARSGVQQGVRQRDDARVDVRFSDGGELPYRPNHKEIPETGDEPIRAGSFEQDETLTCMLKT